MDNVITIQEVKQQLTLAAVLQHYGLKPDKHLRLHCPFHEDKTPSLQVYYKTHTAYCFSSNCKTHGKSLDVIDFIMHKENSTKHQAIEKAKSLLNGQGINDPATQLTKTAVLTKLFTYFKNGVHNSLPAKEYLQQRALDFTKTEVGYNAGQFHHGTRKEEHLIKSCLDYGLLIDKNLVSRTGDKAYQPFGKWCIVFALRDKQNHISGLYFRSTINNNEQRHFYLKDRSGLYPHYPKPETKKLLLTESIIDAATLLQIASITDEYSILSLYGTNGLTPEHITAITVLQQLEEIIIWLNADEAGYAATQKHTATLHSIHPQITITTIQMPSGEDINSLAQTHNNDQIFTDLLSARIKEFSFSTENKPPETIQQPATNSTAIQSNNAIVNQAISLLDTSNPEQIQYNSDALLITLLGGISLQNVDRLRLTLYLRRNPHINPAYSIRQTIDLYQDDIVEKFIRRTAEKLELPTTLISASIAGLTEAAEAWRLTKIEAQKTEKPQRKELTIPQMEQAKKNLGRANLMEWTEECYAATGIIGELTNAMILHYAMTSRRNEDPVSVICLSASGTGKSYLLEKVAECFPAEDIIENTQMTENSFYYFKRDAIKGKIFLIEDMDGAASVEYPLRELITKKRISKTVTLKDSKGNLRTITLTVDGPVTFCGCTTKEKLYEDNANRCLLIYLDGSREQDERVMKYHKQRKAGLIDKMQEAQLRQQLQHMQCILKSLPVINPYAPLIDLPPEVFKPRRTLPLLLSFIESITLYHQYQSKIIDGCIVTHPDHIAWAFKLLKDVLFRKSDELNAAQRNFLETLKSLLTVQKKNSFYAAAIRKSLRLAPRTVSRYLYELQQYGYIKVTGGNKYRKGYEYEIVQQSDDLQDNIDKHIAAVMQRIGEAYSKQEKNLQ